MSKITNILSIDWETYFGQSSSRRIIYLSWTRQVTTEKLNDKIVQQK